MNQPGPTTLFASHDDPVINLPVRELASRLVGHAYDAYDASRFIVGSPVPFASKSDPCVRLLCFGFVKDRAVGPATHRKPKRTTDVMFRRRLLDGIVPLLTNNNESTSFKPLFELAPSQRAEPKGPVSHNNSKSLFNNQNAKLSHKAPRTSSTHLSSPISHNCRAFLPSRHPGSTRRNIDERQVMTRRQRQHHYRKWLLCAPAQVPVCHAYVYPVYHHFPQRASVHCAPVQTPVNQPERLSSCTENYRQPKTNVSTAKMRKQRQNQNQQGHLHRGDGYPKSILKRQDGAYSIHRLNPCVA
jgi:hypothetical protein